MRPSMLAGAAILLFGCESAASAKPAYLTGVWGGPHVGVEFKGGIADFGFDCASGTIDEPIVPLRGSGSFSIKGTYRTGTGGPVKVGQFFHSEDAQYAGEVMTTKIPGTKKETRTITFDLTLEDGSK